MDTLLNYSGGLDSLYVLHQYLTNNPNKTLLVHHCHWMTVSDRHDQESAAVAKTLEWFKSNGLANFEYIETYVDIRQLGVRPIDHQIVAFMTGTLLLNPRYRDLKYYLVCTPKDEMERLGVDMIKSIWADSSRIKNLIRTTMRPIRKPELINVKAITHKYKSQLLEEFPRDLLELYWSCRTPIEGKACDKCHTCKQIARKH